MYKYLYHRCYPAVLRKNQKTNSNGDLLRKAYFWKCLILADISNALVCLLQNVYSLQSFEKHDYEQKDYQRINYHRVSGTMIKTNSSCLVCLVSSCFVSTRTEPEKPYLCFCCAFVLFVIQLWPHRHKSGIDLLFGAGGDMRTSIFPKIMNIAVFVLRRAGRPSGHEKTAI